jgi:hypothetical protein
MILIHTQNGVIETGGKKFVYGSDFVKVYDKRDILIGAYSWQNIVGVTDTSEAEDGTDGR